jgi:hypothetical protein
MRVSGLEREPDIRKNIIRERGRERGGERGREREREYEFQTFSRF